MNLGGRGLMGSQNKSNKKINKAIVSSLAAVTLVSAIQPLEVSAEISEDSNEEIIIIEDTIKDIENLLVNLSEEHSLQIKNILELDNSELSNILEEGIVYHLHEEESLAKETYDLVLNHQNLPIEYIESIEALKELLVTGSVEETESQLPTEDDSLEGTHEEEKHQDTIELEESEVNEDSSKENSASYRSEEHTSELQSRGHLVCRLL